MTRPLPIACLALALLPSAAIAQTTRADDTPGAEQAEAAQTAAPAARAGNAKEGRLLTYTCQGCHGIPGYKNAYPNYHVPRIGGQSTEYLVNALNEYRNGTRKHPTMEAQARSFSDQDIADIAAYLSELAP